MAWRSWQWPCVIVAALEAQRARRTAAVVLMCAAGVVGTWTLPQFGIGFAATLVVLLIDRRLRARVAIGLVISVAAILVWFWPHFHRSTCVAERGRRRSNYDDLGHHGPD